MQNQNSESGAALIEYTSLLLVVVFALGAVTSFGSLALEKSLERTKDALLSQQLTDSECEERNGGIICIERDGTPTADPGIHGSKGGGTGI